MENSKNENNEAMVNSIIISSDAAGASESTDNGEELQKNCISCEDDGFEEESSLSGEEEDLEKEAQYSSQEIKCPQCDKGGKFNCEECCKIVENKFEKFGYQQDVECNCHDICVQDTRLICVKKRVITIPVAGLNGAVGCRGGVEITGVPKLDNCRVFCAEESLRTEDPLRCLVIDNEVGVEVTLRIKDNPRDIILVHKAIDKFECRFFEFFRFPDGKGFPRTSKGARDFRDEIEFIDGSCKTIIIEKCEIENTECPQVVVKLKVIDKLWKHENLLVSALRPYPQNITVKQEFNELHQIGPCPPPCP